MLRILESGQKVDVCSFCLQTFLNLKLFSNKKLKQKIGFGKQLD